MNEYQLRGTRVPPMKEDKIKGIALVIAGTFDFSKRKRLKTENGFERLSEYGITLSVIPDKDWLDLTQGHFDPSTMTISVPEKIYINACDGDWDALFVMFHELGHLFLGHKALMHHAKEPPTMSEDSEWQADLFASAIIEHMGFVETRQMSFNFYK